MTSDQVAAVVLLGSLGIACVDVGRAQISVPLFVAGTEVTGPITGMGDAQIELDRAELAFGPLYICAGAQAGELCETARLEWLEAVGIDALDPTAHEVGELTGLEGSVRSWMFDLGMVSLLTQQQPLILPAAQQLGDSSLRLAGRASVSGVTIPFTAAVVVQQEEQTEIGVPVVRKSSSEVFEHEVMAGEPGLLVRFDARTWVSEIDFAALLEDASCTPEGPPLVCAGQLEQTCDPGGALLEQRDCAALGQVCVRGLGCTTSVDFVPETQGYRAIHNQLTAGPRPSFEWEFSP